MVAPLIMAGLAGGFKLLEGLGASQSAKSQRKRQAANDMVATLTNQQAVKDVNKANYKLGQQLGKELKNTKEVTTEVHSGRDTVTSAGSVDYEQMMKDAEAAGFNPVTWVNAGGLSAYSRNVTTSDYGSTVTTTRTGHNAGIVAQIKASLMSPQLFQMQSSQVPLVPNATQAIGQAGQAAVNTFAQQDAMQQSQDFQREMLSMSLDAYAKRAQSNKFGMVPNFSTSGGATVKGSPGLTGITGRTQPLELGDNPTVTNPNAPHWLFPLVDPTYPDVKTMTDREGESEFFETFNSGMSKLNDMIYNITGLTSKERAERYGKPVLDFFKSMGVSIKDDPGHSPLKLTVKPKAK